MTEWKSEKQRNTAIKALKVLSNTRTGKQGLVNYIVEMNNSFEDLNVYDNQSKIRETIDYLVDNDEFPVDKSSEGSFYERTDSGVVY